MPVASIYLRFLNSHRRPSTISLEEARARPEIVYHSVKHLDQYPTCAPPRAAPAAGSYTVRRIYGSNITLIPLAVAQARDDIKYRIEGDEMRKIREAKLAVRGVARF